VNADPALRRAEDHLNSAMETIKASNEKVTEQISKQ
jgi:hypothetical protein